MTETAITIRTTKGEQTVGAFVFGAWAVHREVNYNTRRTPRWAITHVRTGYCVPPFYTEDLSKAMALKVARALDERHGDVEPSAAIGKQLAETIWRVSLGGKP